MLLIGSQVNVLRHDERTRLDALTGNAAHDGLDVLRADLLARFHLDVCLPMTDEHLTGHLRVVALCVAEVNDCPCYPVRHLVGVAWVHFLKHDFVVLWERGCLLSTLFRLFLFSLHVLEETATQIHILPLLGC